MNKDTRILQEKMQWDIISVLQRRNSVTDGLQKLERIRYDVDLDFISTNINRISVYREKNIKQMSKAWYIIYKDGSWE